MIISTFSCAASVAPSERGIANALWQVLRSMGSNSTWGSIPVASHLETREVVG